MAIITIHDSMNFSFLYSLYKIVYKNVNNSYL